MSDQTYQLIEKLRKFDDEVKALVETCSDETWQRVCHPEEWSVGVVARHIGAAHYRIMESVKLLLKGTPLPEMTEEDLTERANQHARKHADCTRTEVSALLKENGTALVTFINGLTDNDLQKSGYSTMLEKEITAGQLIDAVVLKSGGEHLASIKKAIAN